MKTITLSEVATDMLRAWADAGIISVAAYVEEMARRQGHNSSAVTSSGNSSIA